MVQHGISMELHAPEQHCGALLGSGRRNAVLAQITLRGMGGIANFGFGAPDYTELTNKYRQTKS